MRFSRRKAGKGSRRGGSVIMAMRRHCMDADNDTPLRLDASGFVDHLARLEDASAAEVERITHVYHEIERRDGAAQWHTALWFRVSCVLIITVLVAVSAVVYLAVKASQVQAFVQPVQLTEEGKMILVGIPQDLLAYAPEESQWMDMLAQWVTKRRWRGDEAGYKR